MRYTTPRLERKTAVVTGVGSGIGRECALMFARHGAHVIGLDLQEDAAQATLEQARVEKLDLCVVGGLDLTDETGVDRVTGIVGGVGRPVDILLNAAAFATFKWIEDLGIDDWKHTLTSELDIVFLITKSLWPNMVASGSASIVNLASANAHIAMKGSPALAHCAGKGGVLAMTRQLAMEGAEYGIRANTISPGFIKTEATTRHCETDPDFVSQVLAKNMIRRLGEAEDVAWLATYLASNESSYVTGSDFKVDAGATAW